MVGILEHDRKDRVSDAQHDRSCGREVAVGIMLPINRGSVEGDLL